MGKAIDDILQERNRQIDKEGFSHHHDDKYNNHELSYAAAGYALTSTGLNLHKMWLVNIVKRIWPWDEKWLKNGESRRDLVKAGALIVAAIEQIDRRDKNEN